MWWVEYILNAIVVETVKRGGAEKRGGRGEQQRRESEEQDIRVSGNQGSRGQSTSAQEHKSEGRQQR